MAGGRREEGRGGAAGREREREKGACLGERPQSNTMFRLYCSGAADAADENTVFQ